MYTVLGQVQQSHPWFWHPQQLIFRYCLDFLCRQGTHYLFPPQVLAQHGHLCHSHRGEWGPPAPAPCPSPYIPVAQGPAQTRPDPAAHCEPRGEDAEDWRPRHGEDQRGGWAGDQQHISSKVGVLMWCEGQRSLAVVMTQKQHWLQQNGGDDMAPIFPTSEAISS